MRIALASYLDLGVSFGLGDDVFEATGQAGSHASFGDVGIVNPLGAGLTIDVIAAGGDLIALWREMAIRQVARPEMDIGWPGSPSRPEFEASLRRYLEGHALSRCELTLYGIGTAYLYLEFVDGIPVTYAKGFVKCFEFAAYLPQISEGLHHLGLSRAHEAVGREHRGLIELARREVPGRKRDIRGYEESWIFSTFTHLMLCIDEGDEAIVDELDQSWLISPQDVVEFEYHGKLHFAWEACVIQPRYYPSAMMSIGYEDPRGQIDRMMLCIQIAHVFLATCEAFTRLFHNEIQRQVGGYINKAIGGRGAEDLNRLRTLALAVVSLTKFSNVTPTAEDRKYFAKFEAASEIVGHHQYIQNSCEILYNVQIAEHQHQVARQQGLLNTVVFLLTSLTLVSVMVDAYNFIREDAPLINSRMGRVELLVDLVIAIALLLGLLVYVTRPRRRFRR